MNPTVTNPPTAHLGRPQAVPLRVLSFLLSLLPLTAQDGGDRAMQLRNAAGADWEQRHFRDACDKLQQALSIYADLPGDWTRDRAIVMRALVWNEAEDGQHDAAMQWLQKLVTLVPPLPKPGPNGECPVEDAELRSAFAAIYNTVKRAEPPLSKIELIDRAHTMFHKHGHALLAAQCLHDKGSLHGEAGQLATMRTLLNQAANERRRLGDRDGLAWSLNNLCHYELLADNVDAAVKPLLAAHELLVTGRGLAAQQALAFNLNLLFQKAPAAAPSATAIESLWSLARICCESSQPFVVPPDRVVRETMNLAQQQRGGKDALAAARRALSLIRPAWPVEVRADVAIRAATTALLAGKSGESFADQQMSRLDVGTGPCARHLAARRDAVLAALYAQRNRIEEYESKASAAVDSMVELGDRAALFSMLEQVTAVGLAPGKSQVHEQLIAQLAELRLSGGPGGAGGSALSERIGTVPEHTNEHTVFFTLAVDTKTTADDPEAQPLALLVDRLGGKSWPLSLQWKPHNTSCNGCGIGQHGGYFVVRSMLYGGAANSGGAAGQSSLDELGNYLPLSDEGTWEITQNGAVRFVRRP